MDREQTSVIARFDYAMDNDMEFTSITNFMTNDYAYDEDGDALGLPILTFQTFVDYSQFSQEFRLAGGSDTMRWQTGAYFLDMEWDGGTSVTGAPGFGQIVATGRILTAGGVDTALATASPGNGFEGALSFQDYVLDSSNWSMFGQAEFDLSDRLTFIAGARWSQDDKDIDWALQFTDNFNPVPLTIQTDDAFAATNPGANVVDYGDWAGRLALNYDLTDATMIFGSINRGIKGGNWSLGGTPNITATTFQHKEEVILSYEAGFKTESDTYRLNGTVFLYDYEDYQAFSLAGGGPFISNSNADASGAELEFFRFPTENWDVVLGAAVMDSDIDQVLGAAAIIGGGGGVNILNAELPNAPSVSLNYLFRYNWDMGSGNVAAQIDGAYYGDQFLEVTNGSGSFQEAYNVANARLTYGDDRFNVSAWVKNFTDETYKQYALDLGSLGTTTYYAMPITFGITGRINF
jgi:iron complex outermembrane receptor protein